ncbi:MAG: hypothetical protein J7M30_13135 [Deltaproteobacteria bacterium]|nr:hypothetical protein [Deltaproteobacteria bacterium]
MILLVVIFAAVVASSNQKTSSASVTSVLQKRYVERDGKAREADAVFDAWTSGDFKAMLAQLNQKTTFVDRHFLLMNIVGEAYKHRDDPEMRTICHQVAQMHIDEFKRIKPALKRSLGVLPRVPTFQQYAIVLTGEERFTEAIAVCEAAIKFGLSDGT